MELRLGAPYCNGLFIHELNEILFTFRSEQSKHSGSGGVTSHDGKVHKRIYCGYLAVLQPGSAFSFVDCLARNRYFLFVIEVLGSDKTRKHHSKSVGVKLCISVIVPGKAV